MEIKMDTIDVRFCLKEARAKPWQGEKQLQLMERRICGVTRGKPRSVIANHNAVSMIDNCRLQEARGL